MIATFIAAVVLFATPPPASAPVRSAAADCPREMARVIEESPVEFPPNAHPTHDRVRFLLDLGSDGRIRRLALVESSGDAAVDELVGKSLAEDRFAAPSSGCVTSSTVFSRWWNIPAEELASPEPAAPSSPLPCAAPFVRPNRLPIPRRREVPGTAVVDVTLDANARVTAVHLAQSSGNKKTDYAAAVAARNGFFVFEHQPGCTPAATTYRLELTFR
jgi:TonB family protein